MEGVERAFGRCGCGAAVLKLMGLDLCKLGVFKMLDFFIDLDLDLVVLGLVDLVVLGLVDLDLFFLSL